MVSASSLAKPACTHSLKCIPNLDIELACKCRTKKAAWEMSSSCRRGTHPCTHPNSTPFLQQACHAASHNSSGILTTDLHMCPFWSASLLLHAASSPLSGRQPQEEHGTVTRDRLWTRSGMHYAGYWRLLTRQRKQSECMSPRGD